MKPVNVLITAASRRVSLVRSFRLAVKKTGGKIFTADNDMYSSALFFSHNHYKVPLVLDPLYIKTIEELVNKENINLIIPTIDPELPIWAEKKEYFKQMGVHVAISPLETIKICDDKWTTYQFFKDNQLPFPETYLPHMLTYNMKYPLFIKPRSGRGSVNSFPIRNKRELDFFLEYVPNPVIQDYLDGKEFTVDAYFSEDYRLISMVARYRLVIRSGVSDRGRTFKDPLLTNLVEDIGKKMKFCGPINIQGKILKDQIVFFEINPRFSGGIQLTLAAGANFPEFIIKEMHGHTLTPQLNEYRDHLTMASYEDSIFLDAKGNVAFFYTTNSDILPSKNKMKL